MGTQAIGQAYVPMLILGVHAQHMAPCSHFFDTFCIACEYGVSVNSDFCIWLGRCS